MDRTNTKRTPCGPNDKTLTAWAAETPVYATTSRLPGENADTREHADRATALAAYRDDKNAGVYAAGWLTDTGVVIARFTDPTA